MSGTKHDTPDDGRIIIPGCKKPSSGGGQSLQSALLGKLSFWLIVIGALALVTPEPAWPELPFQNVGLSAHGTIPPLT